MDNPFWQLQKSIDAVLFDCDGTLTMIEGIDTLAEINGHAELVKQLTADAMSKSGLTPAIYQQRLELVLPTQAQVLALGQKYYDQRVPDVIEVFAILKKMNKKIYIISAGLYPAVAKFGALLGVPESQIYAVPVEFDAAGNYQNFDSNSPLTRANGKREIVQEIKSEFSRLLYIGDGLNDLDAYDEVTRFVGFGGVFHRANIVERCEYYINTLTLAPLLPLVLTAKETAQLTAAEHKIYQRGLSGILLKPDFK